MLISYQPHVERLTIAGQRPYRVEAHFKKHPFLTASFEASVDYGPWQGEFGAWFDGASPTYLALTEVLLKGTPAPVEMETDLGLITMDAFIGDIFLDFDGTVSIRCVNAGPIAGSLPGAEVPA